MSSEVPPGREPAEADEPEADERWRSEVRWSNGPAGRLNKLLERAGLSNTDLAGEMNMTDGAISRYRSGERIPNAERLAYMVKRAGGSADEVLGIGAHEAQLERLRRKIVGEIDAEIQDAKGRLESAEPERKS